MAKSGRQNAPRDRKRPVRFAPPPAPPTPRRRPDVPAPDPRKLLDVPRRKS